MIQKKQSSIYQRVVIPPHLVLLENPPYNAEVSLSNFDFGEGYNSSDLDPKLETVLHEASNVLLFL